MKKCCKCKKLQELTGFSKDKRTKDGYKARCKQCDKKYFKTHKKDYLKRQRDNRNKNKEEYNGYQREWRNKNRDKANKWHERWAKNNPQRVWGYGSISDHKRRGFIVNITLDELTKLAKETLICPLCGVELRWQRGTANGKPAYNSPSLDRINNEGIMELSNVQIICSRCNVAKGTGTINEFINYCNQIVNRRENILTVS